NSFCFFQIKKSFLFLWVIEETLNNSKILSNMKNSNLRPLIFVVVVALLYSGCAGLQKMKKNAEKIQFKVTPEVLEAHAGEVDLSVDGKFPAKYFNKKATLVATPVLKYDGGQT